MGNPKQGMIWKWKVGLGYGDSKDEIFYTPLKSQKKENTNFVNVCPKPHLKVDNQVTFYHYEATYIIDCYLGASNFYKC